MGGRRGSHGGSVAEDVDPVLVLLLLLLLMVILQLGASHLEMNPCCAGQETRGKQS